MLYSDAFNYQWTRLAAQDDRYATRRLKKYQKARLRRALLARSIKPYFLEVQWTNTTGLAGERIVAATTPLTEPLIVLDAAIRTTGSQNGNNFEILLERSGGDARVQMSRGFLKDEHLFTGAQYALRNIATTLGHGACWPLSWPVGFRLEPNELILLTSKVLPGGVTAGVTTFVQFRAISVKNQAEDDQFVAELRDYIASTPEQMPEYLSMFTDGFHSIAFPAVGALQRTTAKTREVTSPLLISGYSALFARATAGGSGSTANPKWRLTASSGHSFSKEEVDVNTFAFAAPDRFWQALPYPFLLPRGSSLAASFTTRDAIATELERIENYVIFRGVSI